MRDPILHSHIEDQLPENHRWAWDTLYCRQCRVMVHATNECMQTWVETGQGAFCLACFSRIQGADALGDEWGLS